MTMPHWVKGRMSWDGLALIGLLIALAVLGMLKATVESEGETRYPEGSTYDAQAKGARALKLWVEALGYRTTCLEGASFRPDASIDALFILSPSEALAQAEVDAIDDWLKEGGTLVLAGGDALSENRLLKQFDLEIKWLPKPADFLISSQPLWTTPPVQRVPSLTEVAWKSTRTDYVTLLSAEGEPALISWPHGSGQVFAITTLAPFTNAGLKDEGNAALVYHLVLAGAGRQGRIAFDEYHHGLQTAPSLSGWLWRSRTGWAMAYSAGLLFFFLALGGRHFGAPLPLPEQTAPRTTGDYIHALANLKRRAARRPAVLAHYRDHLKRHLGRLYRIDVHLPDDAFVRELAAFRSDVDREGLTRLLADLRRSAVDEREMVRLAEETTRWMSL